MTDDPRWGEIAFALDTPTRPRTPEQIAALLKSLNELKNTYSSLISAQQQNRDTIDSLKAQLASAQATAPSAPPTGSDKAGAPGPNNTPAPGQVYISAPAAGAVALIAAIVGGGAGYAIRGHLDKGKHKKLAAKETPQIEEEE